MEQTEAHSKIKYGKRVLIDTCLICFYNNFFYINAKLLGIVYEILNDYNFHREQNKLPICNNRLYNLHNYILI